MLRSAAFRCLTPFFRIIRSLSSAFMSTYLTAYCFFSRGRITPRKIFWLPFSLTALKTSNSRLALDCFFSSSLTTLLTIKGFLNGLLDACLDCDKGRPPYFCIYSFDGQKDKKLNYTVFGARSCKNQNSSTGR